MSEHTMTALRNGDIYRWYWREGHGGPLPYHCKSNLALVKDGHLFDTYWSWGSSADSEVDPSRVTLTLLGNVNDMTKVRPYEARYYRRRDVVDMRHSNDSGAPVYVKAGARRDPGTMRELAFDIMRRAESEIRRLQERVKDMEAAVIAIDRGDFDDVSLPVVD